MTVSTASMPGVSQASSQTNPFAQARSNVMTAVASKLGLSQTQLQTALQSGQSLSDIATKAGVSTTDLDSTISTALKASGLPAGTDISAMTSRMAGHHRHHHSSATSTAASSDSSSLSSTDITALTDSTGSTTSVDTYA